MNKIGKNQEDFSKLLSEVIDTLGNLEKGDFRGDMKKGSANR